MNNKVLASVLEITNPLAPANVISVLAFELARLSVSLRIEFDAPPESSAVMLKLAEFTEIPISVSL